MCTSTSRVARSGEGFETATKAAAGAEQMPVDMPLNSSPVTVTVAALEEKIAASEGKRWVDVGFHAGVVPGHIDDLEPLIDAGVGRQGVSGSLGN
ncbi:MAG: hypothetical protein M9910_08765 [Kiritimatiellae bacterium]|nr:hypothetical protein [Kiritimatiellia bacterium]